MSLNCRLQQPLPNIALDDSPLYTENLLYGTFFLVLIKKNFNVFFAIRKAELNSSFRVYF